MVKKVLIYIVLAISLIGNGYLYWRVRETEGTKGFKVIEVLDGDSFIIEGNQGIRLANINAPELTFCLGKEAKLRLEGLILGKYVTLEYTAKSQYGRLIALVYQGQVLVNETLLAEGLGRYDSTGSGRDEEMLTAANKAKDAGLGVYGKCTQTKPLQANCLIKGNLDKHSSQKIYHIPGCSGYAQVSVEADRGEGWFCSEKEAQKEGYVKSQTCYGRSYK